MKEFLMSSNKGEQTAAAVVITGVSTGIGWGTAKVLVGQGVHVFGSVRKAEDAQRLQDEFGAERFTPLLFDVTDEGAVQAAATEVRQRLEGRTLLGLVNNAGIAIAGPLLHQSVSEFRQQLEVNLIGPFVVTQAFAPLLGADTSLRGSPGRIVNMSSVSGRIGVPFLGAYVASKHGLEGLSESLRRELLPYGIDVIVVGPGAVATPIWDKAEKSDARTRYGNTDYASSLERFGTYMLREGPRGFPPERVGQVVWTALTTRRPRLRYAVVPQPLANWTLPTTLPRRMVDQIIARRLGLVRRTERREPESA
jgi:NAD(P)-dependent dehydrogenase (short-subunit alcohol dehydrogenase family)